jgi:triosephosphate isomerase
MRIPLVAGNWKMYKTISEARDLVAELVRGLSANEGVQKVLCPPFTSLLAVSALIEGTEIKLGAQNMYWENVGAYTGEISPLMISELCSHVIIGHSERREYFGEGEMEVNKKVKAALENNLKAIVCVGETLEQREADKTEEVVRKQVLVGLEGVRLAQFQSLIIAYEPVWAIGTGMASTPADADNVIENVIRTSLATLFGDDGAISIQVLYGGSVKKENALDFFDQPNIDGALVGGASLRAEEFIEITQAARVKSG